MCSNFALLFLLLLISGSIIVPLPVASQDGSKDLEQASVLNAQVVKLYEEKKVDEALPLAQKVLEIRQRLLPGNDRRVLDALVNLGELYLAAKKDSEAEKTLGAGLKAAEAAEE